MNRSSILIVATLILTTALIVAVGVIRRFRRQRDAWARIVTRLWDDD